MRAPSTRLIRAGIALFVLSALFAAGMAPWDWLENPSGIFHGSEGTNWGFVVTTAGSWFLPTWLAGTVLALLAFGLNAWLQAQRTPAADAVTEPDKTT